MEARLNGELAQATRAAAGATPKLQRASDLANDITRLQNRFSIVDEQLQNQILEDNAPGTAHLVVAAVAPQHPAVAGVIRNAMVLFLGFVFLGLAAAVIAQKMDPKVYVASDVEQLLGFAPMAQLPDFAEVSDEVADEHLLRLAAGIEYASKEGGMRNCIFTGAAPEAGATTVATRVRDMLEVMGRRTTLIVNAPGTAAPSASLDTRDSLAHEQAHPAARSTALLQQVVEETESGDKSLVLTDAAPLLVSAETEYLVRFADCTIVVVESGVTTRAQVRAAASRLQRLNVAAVGFVLNRVRLAKADPAFRHSVEEVERHLRTQSRFAARQPLGSRLVTAETVSASAELAATAESAATPARPALTAATVALTDAPEQTTAARPAPIAQPELVVVRPEPALPQARLEPEPAFTPSAPTWQELEPIVTAAPVLPLVLKEFEPIVSATPVSPQMWRQPEPMATPPVLPPARKDLEPMVARTPVSPQMWRQSEPMATPPILPPARNDLEPMAAAQPAPVLPPVQPELQPVATQSALASPRPDPQPAVAALPSDIPWWLTEAPARDTALERLGNARTLRTRVGSWETELAGEGGTKATVAVAVEEKAQASPSRLSGLRGLFFALGFKELKEAGQPAPEASGAAAAPAPQPEPAVPVQAAAVHAPVEPTVTAQAPMETAVPVPTAAPIPEPEPAFAAADGDPLRNYSPRRVTAEPEFLPPKLEKPTRRDRRDTFDDVQILPSWRGQYKKKD
jgi:hypothetical protein